MVLFRHNVKKSKDTACKKQWQLTGLGQVQGTWTSTIGYNESWFLFLSWTSVDISVQYIRIHWSWSHSLYPSWPHSRAVWIRHKTSFFIPFKKMFNTFTRCFLHMMLKYCKKIKGVKTATFAIHVNRPLAFKRNSLNVSGSAAEVPTGWGDDLESPQPPKHCKTVRSAASRTEDLLPRGVSWR